MYAYPLLSKEEALRALKMNEAPSVPIDLVLDALEAASDEIQNFLGRKIVKLGTKHWVEYHTRSRTEPSVLRVLHWPIQTDWSAFEIAEDSDRTYGATSLLTEGTDFLVVNEGNYTSKIVRIDNSVPTSWESGFEAIRITFKGGWALQDVPPTIKRICREYLARQYHANTDQEYAFETVTDARGTIKHFGPVMLTSPMRSSLSTYKDYSATTCVRFTEGTDS